MKRRVQGFFDDLRDYMTCHDLDECQRCGPVQHVRGGAWCCVRADTLHIQGRDRHLVERWHALRVPYRAEAQPYTVRADFLVQPLNQNVSSYSSWYLLYELKCVYTYTENHLRTPYSADCLSASATQSSPQSECLLCDGREPLRVQSSYHAECALKSECWSFIVPAVTPLYENLEVVVSEFCTTGSW